MLFTQGSVNINLLFWQTKWKAVFLTRDRWTGSENSQANFLIPFLYLCPRIILKRKSFGEMIGSNENYFWSGIVFVTRPVDGVTSKPSISCSTSHLTRCSFNHMTHTRMSIVFPIAIGRPPQMFPRQPKIASLRRWNHGGWDAGGDEKCVHILVLKPERKRSRWGSRRRW